MATVQLSNITPPRVPIIDDRTGLISREWYRFFLNLFILTGGGQNTTSLTDLQVGPPALQIEDVQRAIVSYDSLQPTQESALDQIAELQKQIETLSVQPRDELGTMSQLQQDNVPWLKFDTSPVGFPTGATAAGTLYWDDADGIKTLNLIMEDSGGVVQQIGEETYYRIKATSAIANGQVVMFTGTVGASGALKGAPATGLTAFQNEYIMGVATQDIALNGWGYVTWFGLVKGIDTTGGAEAWVDGQILYYNPAVPGGLTKTVPAAPNPKVIVASVVNASSNGSLFVRPTFGSALGSTDSNVQIGTLANGNLLIYNTSTNRWENATLTAGSNVTITNGPGSITIASSNPGGTVTSVGLSAPTGFSVSGSPVTSTGTLALSFASGYSLPTNASQNNWDTAYTERKQWDGGNTGLTASTGRTSLGATTVGSNLFTLTNPSAITFLRVNADNTVSALDAATFRTAIGAGTGNGSVTSVAMTVPTGLSISGTPITTSGTFALTLTSGYSIPTTASQTNWDTAYTERKQWDGGSTGLVAATGRTSLGATTVGSNLFTLTNPGAITFLRVNADNTVSALDAATFRTAIGAGTGNGSVTSVSGTGTVNGLTLTGTVTSSGSLTLGGTLSGIANSALTNSSITFGTTAVSLGGTVSALNSVSIGVTTPAAGKFNSLTSTVDATINGVIVGAGGGSVSGNLAIGNGGSTLGSNTTGAANVALGQQAAANITTGNNNVAIGVQALYGSGALTEQRNTAVGTNAGQNITGATGFNTLIGSRAGFTNTTGGFNTYVGEASGYSMTGANNSVFGRFAGNDGSLNITASNQYIVLSEGTGVAFAWVNASSSSNGWLQKNNSASWSTTSDAAIKTNVQSIVNGLDVINALRSVEFDYILSGDHDAGFIAQEYRTVLPAQVTEVSDVAEAVKKLTKGRPLLTIQQNLVPYLVNAVQQLDAKIEALMRDRTEQSRSGK